MKGYVKYYGQKLIWYLITFVIALMLNFFLPRLMPGDPVANLASDATAGMTDSSQIQLVVQQYKERFGLDKSYPEQFLIFVRNMFQGDLGVSFTQYPRTVVEIISESIGWTIALQLPAIIVGWLLGNVLGAIAAYIRKGFDKVAMPFFMLISSMPAFGMAIILLWIFGLTLKWLPIAGGYGFDLLPTASWEFVVSIIRHYQLPFWSMVLITVGGQSIGMRSMSIYELNADYVKYSRFLGIKDRKIVGYVFRNAMLPQITGLALSLGTMVGGNIVAEMIFSYPGIGTTLVQAVTGGDYPLISGCTLIITVLVLIANLVVEILYGIIDPRVKAAQQESAA